MRDSASDIGDMEANEVTQDQGKNLRIRLRGKGIRALLCVLILVLGLVIANYLIRSAPKANRRSPAKMIPLVKVQTVQPVSHIIIISAMGTVIPARELVLKSRVTGEVVQIHPEFTEGGFLPKGTVALKVDDADYRLAVAQKESAVVTARYALKLELGHQQVAKREWALLNGEMAMPGEDGELALRKPHLEKVESDLAAAEADLKQAKLDLERTRIVVPFNAIVRSTQVEMGSQVSPQNNLGELVGTDAYRVKVSVPADRLAWIVFPHSDQGSGASAQVFYRHGAKRSGMVFKLLSDLELEGRMARLLVSLQDPLGLKSPDDGQPALLIGEYVRVEIEGQQIEDVYRISRTALRDDGKIWIAGKDNTLQIRHVKTFWRDSDTVLLKEGLHPGERLVVSDLATPVAGMPLKIEETDGQRSTVEGKASKSKQDSPDNGQ